MASQILLIPDEIHNASNLAAYLRTSIPNFSLSKDQDLSVNQIKSGLYDILIVNPIAVHDFFDTFKTAKILNPNLELILCSTSDQLDLIENRFADQPFSYHPLPVNERSIEVSICQAAEKIALKHDNRRYFEELIEVNTGKALLNQLFDEVPCYISVQDKDLRITKANRRFKTHFGENIGEFCYEVYKDRTSPCEACPVVETFKDGKSHRTEETVISKTGKKYNVLTLTAPITNDRGVITRVMELSVNITQIRQFQDHMASLGLMLGSMFHGVKGTLTALDGGLYQLETGIAQDDSSKVSLAHDQIKSMVDKIKKMVVEILDYAKSRELNYEAIQTRNFVEGVEQTCRPVADKAGVELTVVMEENLGQLEVDAGWLEAALVNFLENAVEACVADDCKASHKVEFKISRPMTDQICFTVADNGTGMDHEVKDKLFSLFFTSKGPKGTGMGMFIANRVIRYHGGRVSFMSTPGKGTVFDILLPIQKPGSVDGPILTLTDFQADQP